MELLFYAHGGSGNHGCEALVRSTAGLLGGMPLLFSAEYDEDCRFHLPVLARVERDTVTPPRHRSAAYLLAACQIKLTGRTTLFTACSRQALLRRVRRDDICLSIGGDNYCYAGWETLADLNLLLHRKGAKTVLWACSIDPEVLTPQMVRDLKRYDLITVREPLTRDALARAGVVKNVREAADPAFLLEARQVPLPSGFCAGNTVGLNLSPLLLRDTDRRDTLLSAFDALVQHILDTTDGAVALIPHVIQAGNSDFSVLQPIYERFCSTGRVLLVPEQNCMQLKYVISQCRLFIGARTHATIAAYSTGVPTLALGYSVKSHGIAVALFGTDRHYVLPVQTISEETLLSAYDWLDVHAAETAQKLCEVLPRCRESARRGKQYLNALYPYHAELLI